MSIRSLAVAMALFLPTAGIAATLNFNDFSHGDIVSSVEVLGVTGSVEADGNSASSPDVAVAFNTRLSNTADPDLEAPFEGPNGQLRNFGRALIIQENPLGVPDDDGNGGIIRFTFESALNFLGFIILDDATITVTSDTGETLTASAPDDNSFRRVNAGWENVQVLTFDFGTHSGAIDNLRFDPPSQVPVPAAFPLLAGAIAALGWGARRRRG